MSFSTIRPTTPRRTSRKEEWKTPKRQALSYRLKNPHPRHVHHIENFWRIIKQRIRARPKFPETVEKKMRIAVQEEWNQLEPKDWRKFIDSLPERIKEVKQRGGLAT
ncbi:hypothetical protein L873DRAFT_481247 [Choiromyces venosus 120613-1]|uniref:Tc1-like transposase DDE domain-containing protein n=1 Tax=Choiromyces venosus 120613-1 TaxID=1336337 RepID=A0A3N4JUM7_9PEZI|nr:hypothetical protein L873DRAFT_481247 [Choiromyces venosus 120613-1]